MSKFGVRSSTFRAMALALAIAAAGAGAIGCGSRPATHQVTIDATRFQPEVLTISAGDTVVWINKDMFPHTATAQGRFDSGTIQSANSWQYTFKESGDIDYICTLHPTMKGKVTVR